jgi:BirA family transcriptional regulator, biotin operon repressor / biotin---[acetyl-CoA-carboxylase] ligase
LSLQTLPGDQFLPNTWRLDTRDSVDSTNAEAAKRARAGEPAGYAITAREQTAGRGRSGRAWSTGGHDLALSILLRPQLKPAAAAAAGFVAALAVYDLARGVLPASAPLTIKWPNDVLIGDRKLSGILAEAASGTEGYIDWLVLGMGVNLAPQQHDVAPHAIDLETAGGPRLLPEDAAVQLLAHLDHWISQWLVQGFEPIRHAWRERARDLGKPVVARLPNETVEGVALDLAADGALVLRLADGAERRISAGDVFPLAKGS